MAEPRSPDSTISISSLLASCSLETSKGSSSSIEYKDKLYGSATKALEAYIGDYEESLRSPLASTGTISIHSTATLGSTKRRGGSDTNFRPKHSSRRRYASHDPDLLSLTTDDLLDFPTDGSLPFSHVSYWKHRKSLKKQQGLPLPKHTALPSPLMSSLNTRPNRHYSRHNTSSSDLRKLGGDLDQNNTNILPKMDRENHPAYYNNPYSLRSSQGPKSYPRWLTGQKSELGVSGITSIPEVKYPLWIKDYGLLGNSDGHVNKNIHKSRKNSIAREAFGNIHEPSFMRPSHPLFYGGHGKEEVNPDGVGGRLYSGLSDLDVLKHLRTTPEDHLNGSPLRESESFEPSGRGLPRPPENHGSPRTEDVLEGERSWEKVQYSFKSPVPVPYKDEMDEESADPLMSHLAEDFQKDKQKDESNTSSFSGGNHHGPVEALKHMLFNLQAFQQNFTPTRASERVKEFKKVYTEAESEIQRVDQEVFPVNKSLQKALQHLARLKELVGDGPKKD